MKNKRKRPQIPTDDNQVRGEVPNTCNLLSLESSTCTYPLSVQLGHFTRDRCHGNRCGGVKDTAFIYTSLAGCSKISEVSTDAVENISDIEKLSMGELDTCRCFTWQQTEGHKQKDDVHATVDSTDTEGVHEGDKRSDEHKCVDESLSTTAGCWTVDCKMRKEDTNQKEKRRSCQSLSNLKACKDQRTFSNKLQARRVVLCKKHQKGTTKKGEIMKEMPEKTDSMKEDLLTDEETADELDNKGNVHIDDENAKYEKIKYFLQVGGKSTGAVKDADDALKSEKEYDKGKNADDVTEGLDNRDVDELDNRNGSSTGEETTCKSGVDPMKEESFKESTQKIDLPEKQLTQISEIRNFEDQTLGTRNGEESEIYRSVTEDSWPGETEPIHSMDDGIASLNSVNEETASMYSVTHEGSSCGLDYSLEGGTQPYNDQPDSKINLKELKNIKKKELLTLAGKGDLLPEKEECSETLSEKEKEMSEYSEKDEYMEKETEEVLEEKFDEEKNVEDVNIEKFETCSSTGDVGDNTKETEDNKEELREDEEKNMKEEIEEKFDNETESDEKEFEVAKEDKEMVSEKELVEMNEEGDFEKFTKEMKVNGKETKDFAADKVIKRRRRKPRKKNKKSIDRKKPKFEEEIVKKIAEDIEGYQRTAKKILDSKRKVLSTPNQTCSLKETESFVSAKPKSKKPKSKRLRRCKQKSKQSDCDIYLPKAAEGGRSLMALQSSRSHGRQCSDSGASHGRQGSDSGSKQSGSSNDANESHGGSDRQGNSNEDKNNNNPNNSGNGSNPNGDRPGGDGPPSSTSSNNRPGSSPVDVNRPEQDFKKYRKKHSDISVEHWEKFLGHLKEQAEVRERPYWDLHPNPVDTCLVQCMEQIEDLPDDMFECVVCLTINSLLKHYANCNSAYILCDLCTQIFSLITCHVNICSRRDGSFSVGAAMFGVNSYNCNITLCKKICITLTGTDIGAHLKMLWFNVRKKLSRVIGNTETVTTTERKGSVVGMPPSLQSIPENEVPSVTPGPKSGSRILSRKRSNLIPVAEEGTEGLNIPEPQEVVHGEINDNSVGIDAVPDSREPIVQRDRFSSLPMGPPKGHEYQFPSFTDRPAGVKGIGEVVYGDKAQLIIVVQYWDKLKKDYNENGKLLMQYREEGVILHKYQDMLTIGTMRYQKDFQWIKVSSLGNGMSGKCSLATDFQTDAKFCVKEIHISSYEMDEISLITDLDHPYVVQLYGAIRFGERVFIFMEYIAGGCLTEAINAQKLLGQRLSQATALRYFQQLLQVLCYLKSKHILHEDLKGDNILLHRDGKHVSIKVTDFGSARRCQGQVRKGTPPVGTQTQWSPEKAEATGYSFPAEVWAAVCVLVHMLSGTPPWIRRFGTFKTLIFVIVDNSPPLEDIPVNISEAMSDLIEKGFTLCQGMRPTPEQLLLHHAFRILDDSPNTENYSILTSGFHSKACIEDDISKDLREIYRNLDKNSGTAVPPSQSIQVYTVANQAGAVGPVNNAEGGSTNPGGGASNFGGGVANPGGGAINPVGGSYNHGGGAINPGGGATNPGRGSINPVVRSTRPVGGSTNTAGGVSGQEDMASMTSPSASDKSDAAKEMNKRVSPSDPSKNTDFTQHFQNYLYDTTPAGIPGAFVDNLVEYNPDLPIPQELSQEFQTPSVHSDDALNRMLPNFEEILDSQDKEEEFNNGDDSDDEVEDEDDPFKNFDLNEALKNLNIGTKGENETGENTNDDLEGSLSASSVSTLQTKPIDEAPRDTTLDSINDSFNDDDLFQSGSPKSMHNFDFNINAKTLEKHLPKVTEQNEPQAPNNPPSFIFGLPDHQNQTTRMSIPSQLGAHSEIQIPHHAYENPQNIHQALHIRQQGPHRHHNPHYGHQTFQHGHQNSQHGHQHFQHGHKSTHHGQQSNPHGQTHSHHGHQHGHQRLHFGHQSSQHGHQRPHTVQQSPYNHVPTSFTNQHGMPPPNQYSLYPRNFRPDQVHHVPTDLQMPGREVHAPQSLNPNLMRQGQPIQYGYQPPGNRDEYRLSFPPEEKSHYQQNDPQIYRNESFQRPVYSQQPHSYAGYYQTPAQYQGEGNNAPRSTAGEMPRTSNPASAPSMLNAQRPAGAHFPGQQPMQHRPNERIQYIPQEMIVSTPHSRPAGKHTHLQLDVEKAKHGPASIPSTYAQTAPVSSPPKTPKLTSPPFKRTSSYIPPPIHTRLSLSSTSQGSRSMTPKSQLEEQERALLEFGDIAKEALSQHDGSVIGLEEDEDQTFEVQGEGIDLVGDVTPQEWESMAVYLENSESENTPDTRIEITFKKRGEADALKMRFRRSLPWESIIEDELSRHEISTGIDRFCLRHEDGSLIDIDSSLGEENIVAYLEPADEQDWWWVEKGMIMRANRRN